MNASLDQGPADADPGAVADVPPGRPSAVRTRWHRAEAPAVAPAAETTARPPTVLRDLATVLLLFVACRGMLFTVDYFGRMMTTAVAHRDGGQGTGYWINHPFWDGYVRWDSLHFLKIIRNGYRIETDGPWKGMSTDAAFLPLYPYAVKALGQARIPGYGKAFTSVWPPGLIISNLSLFLAMFYMLRIARMSLDEDGSRRSLVYILVFPASFFMSSFYSEGLFLLTTTASFYHFLKGQHARCGAWGMLAAMTRSPGVMLLPAFVVGHLWERRFRVGRSDASLLWIGLIPCGLAAVMVFFYWKLGDPFAFSKAHTAWGRHYTWPHETLLRSLRQVDWSLPIMNYGKNIQAIDLVSSIAFLALPFFLLRGFHKALPVYAILMIVMPLSTGLTMSIQRCESIIFPSFFVLAKFGENRNVDRFLVLGSALFLSLFKLAFSNGHSFI
jgi:hypothetical protein